MIILYNILLFQYHLAIYFASFFNRKAKQWIEGRKNIFQELKNQINLVSQIPNSKLIWVHCASFGEFEQARPLIEKFKPQSSELKILITFFSPSGYEIRKNYELADYVFYLPIDSKKNAEKFISIVQPSLAIFVKYEFWYHYLNTLFQKQIPTYVISAHFRENQHFFKWYGKWFRELLFNITHIFVQNNKSFQLLQSIGLQNVSISGDTRFDRVYATTKNHISIPIIERFKNGKRIFIGGSIWQEDEEVILPFINTSSHDLKYILVPHDIHEEHIKKIISSLEVTAIRFSETNESNVCDANVLIIDNIGMLSQLYYYADIAYIGGAFGKGLHNILEPAAFGKPVLFGANYSKFPEAQQLIDKGGAFSVSDYKAFQHRMKFLLNDEMIIRIASEISKNYVRENRGATERIFETITN